ncbi:uncharacterized protein CIMG_12706 [Coccidioides immitis RS]|uniref:Uncharacterized protein n=1 Tax=Coccidioides immitis (strain RS) TaxID=246410 RepID=A0A0D8JSC4_COCIM|nr:uncharacterized protein CIMG_12706 [Coccidioides immitis RS]KJF60044.1 hypothetical protein CIMG_12706 [Coccidioides immitis RS]
MADVGGCRVMGGKKKMKRWKSEAARGDARQSVEGAGKWAVFPVVTAFVTWLHYTLSPVGTGGVPRSGLARTRMGARCHVGRTELHRGDLVRESFRESSSRSMPFRLLDESQASRIPENSHNQPRESDLFRPKNNHQLCESVNKTAAIKRSGLVKARWFVSNLPLAKTLVGRWLIRSSPIDTQKETISATCKSPCPAVSALKQRSLGLLFTPLLEWFFNYRSSTGYSAKGKRKGKKKNKAKGKGQKALFVFKSFDGCEYSVLFLHTESGVTLHPACRNSQQRRSRHIIAGTRKELQKRGMDPVHHLSKWDTSKGACNRLLLVFLDPLLMEHTYIIQPIPLKKFYLYQSAKPWNIPFLFGGSVYRSRGAAQAFDSPTIDAGCWKVLILASPGGPKLCESAQPQKIRDGQEDPPSTDNLSMSLRVPKVGENKVSQNNNFVLMIRWLTTSTTSKMVGNAVGSVLRLGRARRAIALLVSMDSKTRCH